MGDEFQEATRKPSKTWVQQIARHELRMEKISIQGDREVTTWWMIFVWIVKSIFDITLFMVICVKDTICEWLH